MRVLLLNPPHIEGKRFIREGRCTQSSGIWSVLWPPVTLAYMASLFRQNGHVARILDAPAEGAGIQEMKEVLIEFLPQIVFLPVATPSLESDLKCAQIIQEAIPCKLVVLGTHITELGESVLERSPAIDFGLFGEPEFPALELVKELERRESSLAKDDIANDMFGIKGIIYRTGGGIKRSLAAAPIDDLDSLPFPAWDLLDLEKYKLPLNGRKFLMLLPSRGCPWKCSFCTSGSYYGHRLRSRSVPNIIAEIKRNIHELRVRDFFTWSDTFTANRNFVRSFCESIIEEKLDVRWTCNSRVDTVDPDILALMKRAGCWMISFGIESGSQDILDETGKGITVQQARDAVCAASEAGIKVAGHFILGLPGESKKSLEKTVKLASGLPLDVVQFYQAAPFPGSPLYRWARDHELLTKGGAGEISQESGGMNLPGITPALLKKWQRAGLMAHWKKIKPWKFVFSQLSLPYLRDGLRQTLMSHFGRVIKD